MVFSSPIFIFLFLPVVLGLYFMLPGMRARNLLLLVASIFFYAWGEGQYALLMLFSIGFNYVCGLWINSRKGRGGAGAVLAFAVVVNLGLLAFFKYAYFGVTAALNPLLALARLPALSLAPIHLPIGISFFTFHALSYVIDVYRGNAKVQRSLLQSALYITLFPQLIAGPIIRYKEIATQFAERTVNRDCFALGVRRFVIGLGKKMIIANTVGLTANQIYSLPPDQLTTPLAWLAAVCYMLQLYFDFSGYSDMAIGLARLFGFQFPENFNYPYISQSITEFWRRWHMSLSNWFRDYLYIPLGGNRRGPVRTYFNLFLVFLLCGLWHGANWTFVFWGLYHGFFLIVERLGLGALLARLWRPLRHAYALLVILVGWVFFRADTLAQARAVLSAMAGFASGDPAVHNLGLYVTPGLVAVLVVAVAVSMPLQALYTRWRGRLAALHGNGAGLAHGLLAAAETGAFTVLLVASLARVAADTYNPFIYFRF